MNENEIRLACLRMAHGDIELARDFSEFVLDKIEGDAELFRAARRLIAEAKNNAS